MIANFRMNDKCMFRNRDFDARRWYDYKCRAWNPLRALSSEKDRTTRRKYVVDSPAMVQRVVLSLAIGERISKDYNLAGLFNPPTLRRAQV
jgi:hypothetical protein